MAAIKASIDTKRNVLIIELPLLDTPKETEKMLLVASSGGFMTTDLKVGDKIVRLNAMAGVKK